MTHNHGDTTSHQASAATDATQAVPERPKARVKKPATPLTRLSSEQVARRTERQRPRIASDRPVPSNSPGLATAAEATEGPDHPRAADAPAIAPVIEPPTEASIAPERPNVATTSVRSGELFAPATSVGPRQMTVWEDAADAEVIAGWVLASSRKDALEWRAGAAIEDEWADAAGSRTPPVGLDLDARRAYLRDLTTRDDSYLVQQVRLAIVDLVLEHRFVSEETDRRLAHHGIRFAVWSLARTSDGEFDPFRDLTEDRIASFIRDAGAHLSDGSRATYAAALRRLAAGPTIRHTGQRRKAVAPLSKRIEDGLWAAADAFRPDSWQHQEAKTLLSLTFGAGAMPAEINLAAPDDVLLDGPRFISTAGFVSGLAVSVRLIRPQHAIRDVPVLDERYATWLATRAAQVTGQTYLFKPDRRSRKDAINATTRRLAQLNSAFERFDLPAARNTWAVAALAAGVPFAEWALAAGVGPGTHLPTDLLAYMPTPDRARVEAAFRRTAMRTPPGQ